MNIETAIDFETLSGQQFEELCYDLFRKNGFHSLKWRQGAGDNGRDIEAKKSIADGFVYPYDEQWFIECKNHQSGIGVDDISSKFAWAEAERPAHLILMISSHITQPAQHWIELRRQRDSFKVHILDGKAIKTLLANYPDLIEKWFPNQANQLVKDFLRQWLHLGSSPSVRALYQIYPQIEFDRLEREELAFLWLMYSVSSEELEEYCEENIVEPPYDLEDLPCPPVIPQLKKFASSPYPIFGKVKGMSAPHDHRNMKGTMTSTNQNGDIISASVHYEISRDEYLQVAMNNVDRKLEVYIALGTADQ